MPLSGLRLLVVQDDPAQAQRITRLVGDFDPPVLVVRDAPVLVDALTFLGDAAQPPVDAILVGLAPSAGDGTGVDVVKRLCGVAPAAAVIAMSHDAATGMAALSAGAHDHLLVARLDDELEQAVRHAVLRQQARPGAALPDGHLEDLLSAVVHDLKNPLMIAGGFLEMVVTRQGDELPETVKLALERVVRQHDRMACLLSDLGRWSSVMHDPLVPADVELADLVAVVTQEDGVAAGLDLDIGATPTLWGDPPLLRQAIRCILQNAAQHANPDGRTRVEVRSRDLGWAIQITFADDGGGIPSEQRVGLFAPFTRGRNRDVDRSGMGLAIVNAVAARHGGTAALEDGIEGGISVVLTLPSRTTSAANNEGTS